MALDIINSIMDVVVPPATLLFLLFNYPIILFFQFWSFVLRWIFPERVRGKVVLVTGASSGIGEVSSRTLMSRYPGRPLQIARCCERMPIDT